MKGKLRNFLFFVFAAYIFAGVVYFSTSAIVGQSDRGLCQQQCIQEHQQCRSTANSNKDKCKQTFDACRDACKTGSNSNGNGNGNTNTNNNSGR